LKKRVVVTRRWPDDVEQQLASQFDVILNESDQPFSVDQIREHLSTADALLTTVTDPLTADVFKDGSVRAKIIANFGVGYSHIDIAAAAASGIAVTNTPDVLSECTADLALTLMLMAARRAGEGERELRAGQWTGWRPTHLIGSKLSGKTLGIIGYGRIGRETARRAHHGFGMPIRVYNRSTVDQALLDDNHAVQINDLNELLAAVDFVSLHCPGGGENTGLIGAAQIAAMRSDAYLINTARGEVIDEEALLQALEQDQIGGAGLDVFDGEPAVNPRFLALDNAVLLPHMGSSTRETRNAMGIRALRNLQQFFAGERPDDQVN